MPNFAGIVIEIVGDAKSYIRSAEQTIAMNKALAGSTVSTSTAMVESSSLSAKAQVAATEKAIAATEAQIAAFKALEAQGVKTYGLIAASQAKLNRLQGVTGGAAAGEGALARAKGFASTAGIGFLSAAAGAEIVRRSIENAEHLEAAQRSLDQAIKNTGGNAAKLGAQYQATAKDAARFGVDEITATRQLERATSITGDAAAAQRAYTEALVVSKALQKDFGATLIATSKAQAGQVTALKRIGVILPANATGQEQFNAIMKRYEGQAEANTTATEKFGASLSNLETTLGTTVLPVITPLIDAFSSLLNKINQFPEALNAFTNAFLPIKSLIPVIKLLRGSSEQDTIARILREKAPAPVGPRGPISGGPLSLGSFADIASAVQAEAASLRSIFGAEERAALKRAADAEKLRERIQAQIEDSIHPLRLEVALARAQALGKPLIKILKELRQAAYKALASGKLSLEQQLEAWNQITSLNQQLADQSTAQVKGIRAANTRILTADLGLTRAQRDELRARLASLDARGRSLHHAGVGAFGYEIGHSGRPIQVRVDLDGRKIAENTTRHQQRRNGRNSAQRRGPNAGN